MLTYLKLFFDDLDALEPFGDAERGRLLTALLIYGRTGEAPQLCGNERFLFPMLKARMDRDREAYEREAEERREAGRRGANARVAKQSQAEPSTAKRSQVEPSRAKQSQAEPSKEKEKEKEKDEDEEKDIVKHPSDVCPEQTQFASVPPMPLNDGTEYRVTQSKLDSWISLYPAVDVSQALRNMVGWLNANPKNRKTKSGIERFITTWLSKEQNRAATTPKPKHDEAPSYDMARAIEKMNTTVPAFKKRDR